VAKIWSVLSAFNHTSNNRSNGAEIVFVGRGHISAEKVVLVSKASWFVGIFERRMLDYLDNREL
jgi:hypothetical protein